MTISKYEINRFIRKYVGFDIPIKAELDGVEFWYMGRGESLKKLTNRLECPFKVFNTKHVNKLFRRPIFNLEGEDHDKRRAFWLRLLTNNHLKVIGYGIHDEVIKELNFDKSHYLSNQTINDLMIKICARNIIGINTPMKFKIFSVLFQNFHSAILAGTKSLAIIKYIRLLQGIIAVTGLRYLFTTQSKSFKNEFSQSHDSLLGQLKLSSMYLHQQAINDDLLAMIIAVGDTTANVILWMLIELADDTNLQLKLRVECQELPKDNAFQYNQSLFSLKHCNSFVFEVLRMHSPNILGMKECTTNTTVFGIDIYEGDKCAYSPLFENFNEKVFSNPLVFKSDRFCSELKSNQILSFGVGSHSCIGRNVAQLIMMIVLTNLVTSYRITHSQKLSKEFSYFANGKIPSQEVRLCLHPL